MEQLNPSDLKAILHSKRANVYYLEYCRVMQKDGRVLYLTEAKNENQYWNIGSLENWMNTTNLFNTVHCHVKKHRFQPNSLRALLVARVYFSFNQLNQISILLRRFKWYSSVLDKRPLACFTMRGHQYFDSFTLILVLNWYTYGQLVAKEPSHWVFPRKDK